MSFSLSNGRKLDITGVGVAWEDLPPVDLATAQPAAAAPASEAVASQAADVAATDRCADRDAARGFAEGAALPRDIRQWFGPNRAGCPLELEIGSGKGTFLVRQATLLPEANYIGIEWAKAFWRYAADRCRRHRLGNVKLVRAEAGAFVRSHVPERSLRQVHIYFPDPWPKKRHHKRRLIQAPFLRELHRTLVPAGCIRIATDHQDYFAWMIEHADQVTDIFERLPFTSPEAAGEGELVGTNFERKYRREGRPFQGMVLRDRVGGNG